MDKTKKFSLKNISTFYSNIVKLFENYTNGSHNNNGDIYLCAQFEKHIKTNTRITNIFSKKKTNLIQSSELLIKVSIPTKQNGEKNRNLYQ